MIWHRVLRVDELSPGGARFVSIDGHELALFRLLAGGEFVAVANSCPHAGGNLSAGEVAGSVVTCPWHHWEFDLASGACVHNEQVRVRRYPLRIESGWIEVQISCSP